MIVLLLLSALVTPALAHGPADWIMRGQHRNAAGEWCCGEGDCFMLSKDQIGTYSLGYLLSGRVRVPFTETQPSQDGEFWYCRRPDGTRRCFFAPPPAT